MRSKVVPDVPPKPQLAYLSQEEEDDDFSMGISISSIYKQVRPFLISFINNIWRDLYLIFMKEKFDNCVHRLFLSNAFFFNVRVNHGHISKGGLIDV